MGVDYRDEFRHDLVISPYFVCTLFTIESVYYALAAGCPMLSCILMFIAIACTEIQAS